MSDRKDEKAKPENLLENIGLDESDKALLHIARRYFLSYANPTYPHWESAFDLAIQLFGADQGPGIAVALLNVVRAMRNARSTTFRFTNPLCPDCAPNISDGERLLFRAIQFIRCGDRSRAQIEALILCEGNDTELTLAAMHRLAETMSVRRADAAPATPTLAGLCSRFD